MSKVLMTRDQAAAIFAAITKDDLTHDGVIAVVDRTWLAEYRQVAMPTYVGVQLHYANQPGWEVFAYDCDGKNEIRFTGGLD